MRFRQRLQQPDLQPLLAQYVPLELNVDGPEYGQWRQKYRTQGNLLPQIFIVNSQGFQLYSKSGIPPGNELQQNLQIGIQQTGGAKKLPSDEPAAKDDRRLKIVLRRTRQLIASGRPDQAIEILNGYGARQEDVEPPESLTRMLEKLTGEGRAELEKAQGKLDDDQGSLVGILALVRAQRIYGQLTELEEEFQQALGEFLADSELAELVEQAKQIDQGRSAEDEKNVRKAVMVYRRVISDYPDTLAASLCSVRIQQISLLPLRTWTDQSGEFRVKARLVSVTEGIVVLKKNDGKKLRVPLNKLSESDQDYAQDAMSDG